MYTNSVGQAQYVQYLDCMIDETLSGVRLFKNGLLTGMAAGALCRLALRGDGCTNDLPRWRDDRSRALIVEDPQNSLAEG